MTEPEGNSSSSELFKAIFDAIPTPVLEVDERLIIKIANREAHERWASIQEGASPFYPVILSLKEKPHDCVIEKTFRHKKSFYFNKQIQTGEIFHLKTSHFELKNHKGVLVHLFDISKQEKIQEELQKSETKYRVLFKNMLEGMFQTRPDGKIIAANPALVSMLGYDSEEEFCSSVNVQDLYVDPKLRKILILMLEKEGEVRNFEFELRCKNGGKIAVMENVRVILDKQGNVSHYEGLLTDITDLKHAEEERQKLQSQVQNAQKSKSLEILAGGIAHDFNNLLMGILGNASLALKNLSADYPIYQYIKKIEKSSQDAAELTNQMLAYSGKGKFVIQKIKLSNLIKEMSQLLKATISKKISLNFWFEKNLPFIEADVSQIRQVILNLILNASEAIGGKSGEVLVKTSTIKADKNFFSDTYMERSLPEGNYLSLEISDNGPGMNDTIKNQIFDPFFTTKFKGRGLGLAAVLGIVRGHKGTIKVWSKTGKGTTIKVFFPVIKDVSEMNSQKTSDKEKNSILGKTILVVDDEPVVLEVASSMLESAGHTVLKASDGQKCVELFTQHKGDIGLVLLDNTMPNMNGEEAFRELRKIDPDVKVILSSGYNEQEATSHFVGEGLAGFIQKPYSLEQLINQINEVLDTPPKVNRT